jgi:hypothetical protein
MCRVVDTVLVDQETVYAPRHGHDRLLLGLKGSLNEYELDLLRQRSLAEVTRKPVAAALKEIYRAKDAATAKENLEAFAASDWEENILLSQASGDGSGSRSFRSLPFRRQYAGSPTPRTRSNRLMPSCAGRSKREALFQMTRQRQNSCSWSCEMPPPRGKWLPRNGALQKPNSRSSSKRGSSRIDQPGPTQNFRQSRF